MVHEFKLFFCQDPESGNPYLAVADGEGNTIRTEVESLIADSVNGAGPFPVLVKVDDMKMDINLDELYRKHISCRAHSKMLTFKDRSGKSVRFGSTIANTRYPYSMIVTGPDGEELMALYSKEGHCMSGSSDDELMEYSIEKK